MDGPSVMPLLLRHSPSVMADSSRSHLADILTSRRRTAGTPTASIAVLVLVPDGWVQGQGPVWGDFWASGQTSQRASRTPKNDPSRDPPGTPPDPPKTKRTLNQDR